MATFIGIPGEFQKEKALSRRLNAVMGLFLVLVVTVLILGWISGFVFGHRSVLSSLLALAAVAIAVPGYKVLERQMEKQLRLVRAEESGAAGEREIIPHLKKLPDTYTVVSDLDFADSYGNIDHLVIGPTGIFAIDVKNWRGIVSSDGKGELLLNGHPTDKPIVRYYTRRVMDLKDRLKALTKLDPYIQCVFAFARTRVEARWGTTAAVNCICMDQIADYITKSNNRKPLPPADIPRLIAAAKALKETIAVKKESSSSAAQSQQS